ncbi:hypothetical protein [Pararhodospirillum oryzae]|uniref:Uncharacterized protein n=1 Tax=Pararhodospirillum oryzae TaxID=478448 RepID=A0A512H4Q3_9PROT|nr:hypothetical protein [Pararhodospirillum oryzae]GEO80398.1 hypothetical protein ROR02_05290 [Pararhodospirillum oryzae]
MNAITPLDLSESESQQELRALARRLRAVVCEDPEVVLKSHELARHIEHHLNATPFTALSTAPLPCGRVPLFVLGE